MDAPPSPSVDGGERTPDSPGRSPSRSDLFFRDAEPTSPSRPDEDEKEGDGPQSQRSAGEDAPPSGEDSGRRRWSPDDDAEDDADDALAPEQVGVAPAASAKRTQRRQPPMNVDTFYVPGESGGKSVAEKDDFFDLYCRLNFMRIQERKFGTVNHGVQRKNQIAELENDVRELKRLVAEKRRRPAGSGEEPETALGEPSLRALAVQLELKSKRLACLKAKRCRDLRLDLNQLLKSLGDQLSDMYPHNESLDRMAQRLDQFSWKAPTWIGYRPLLLQKHKAGAYKRWVDAGCPDPPHSVFQRKLDEPMDSVGEGIDDSANSPGSWHGEKADGANRGPFDEPEDYPPAGTV
ncbi:conserved hypothetical protein [Neospora caninum Liverpool]|uniref:Uncharacterized protein n=1 Tax=Neospora caninum (strain Liverpool) TaxID=572307 RepID=F0VC03_NEOCL|nr:conserved hypothetical protein [Neospora caninum Liverpool]CBZ51137.1 conserved hypothetical protein [Neospora caninum Liverpool]|eukprot:XP_003881170.1 conserved hypothetical protein [Neospora caninum Liverpool]